MAVFCLLGTETYTGSAQDSRTQTSTAPSEVPSTPNNPSTSKPDAAKKQSSPQTVSARRRRSRRRRRGKGRYRISSFGDPAAEDNPVGDDPAIRQAALAALGNWNGSVVVVNPNNGRVLSIVNQKLALSSGFTPCSTFKPVVALAALREGIITPTTKLYVGSRQRMDLTEALARSNNVFFQKLGEMLGFRRLAQYAHEFSLGEKASDDIPDESPGRFPIAAPKEGGVGYLAYYGQDIEVTPLQMAAIISAVANGGTLYQLQYPRTADELSQFEPKVRRHLDDLAQYLPEVKAGLEAAVLYGTARLAYDPEMQIYGKTGTCSEDGARLGWFVSYAQDQQPRYVAVVLLRGGRMVFGPQAAEIAGHFYREVLHRERITAQASQLVSPGR
jgi:cell division protein FtsI/penicillin-binding protein 2